MKTLNNDKKLKKTALFLAKILGYSKIIRLKDSDGCPVFEPLFKDGSASSGIPVMLIVRNGATGMMTEEETIKYLHEEYNLAA